MCYFYSVFFFRIWNRSSILRNKANKIIACVYATLGCIRKIVKSDYLLCFCPSVWKNSALTGRICMKYDDASRAHCQSLVRLYFRTSSEMYCSLAIHIMKVVASCRQTIRYSENFFIHFSWEAYRDTQKGSRRRRRRMLPTYNRYM
jgi:hypothetical protein